VLPLRGVLLDDMLCCFTCSTAEVGAKQTLLHGVHRVGTELKMRVSRCLPHLALPFTVAPFKRSFVSSDCRFSAVKIVI